MKSVHIRDLKEETLLGLKRRAARHRRSLQKEMQVLLEEAASMVPPDGKEDFVLNIVSTGKDESKWSRDEIYSDDGR
jgi:plasmid stability protein